MSNQDHRLGVSEVNLVIRHLKIESSDAKKIEAAISEIDSLYGLDGISFDEKSHVLNLAYDASRLCLEGIEDVLAKHYMQVSHDWWTRIKEEYYKFVDQNVKDNASHEPWSCHSAPPKTNKKR
ncbi:hypothetical protein [Neptunomonas antarctica]|jgi:hypothetical protein|uniref:Cation transporter n=1 Tax=Neptunomonas antarctica TaxID=619304 RepID=A0A1N7KVR6_9GAMM|nr:hypothetical protein [Neptunomonas antarctica]SIS65732.1 hypothetical protein SAMN05421760_10317 [Neptunomonas antarctica]